MLLFQKVVAWWQEFRIADFGLRIPQSPCRNPQWVAGKARAMTQPISMPWSSPAFTPPPHHWPGVRIVVFPFMPKPGAVQKILPPGMEAGERQRNGAANATSAAGNQRGAAAEQVGREDAERVRVGCHGGGV